CPLPPPTVWYRLPQRSLLGGLFFSPTVVLYSLSTPYLPQISAMPLAFLGAHTTRSALLNEIWIFVRRGVSDRFCPYLEKGCTDWVGCFFYVLPAFPSTVLGGFVSIAPAVIVRVSSPPPIHLLRCEIAYAISPSLQGRPSRFSRTWYYSSKAFR
ncbi:hypothetical protein EDD15DRAFT_2238774, partial [Pisolithus albus]